MYVGIYRLNSSTFARILAAQTAENAAAQDRGDVVELALKRLSEASSMGSG